MPLTGELIRLMNSIDDVASTLRLVNTHVATMSPEERKQLAEYMRKSKPTYQDVLGALEKVGA